MIFHHQNQGFRQWQRDNPTGFYINRTGSAKNHTVHEVKCMHLPEADFDKRGEVNVTRTAKEVFEDKTALQQRLKELLPPPKICKTCNPI